MLGLLLLLIYINDLSDVNKPLSILADDISIYFEASDLFSLQKVMNLELQQKFKKLKSRIFS